MRAYAEWEKQEALLIALPHEKSDWKPYLGEILESYYEFVKAVAKYQKVILLAHENADISAFGIPNVKIVRINTNDTWIRDFGAITAYDESKKSRIFYDFSFDAWGGKFEAGLDNAVNGKLFESGEIKGELRQIPLVLEGGSVEFNGAGVLLTTSECLLNANRGSRKKADLQKELKELFGLNRIIWLENGAIKGDDTDSHIDTLARFIDENTIAYASCDDENDENYAGLKAMKAELEQSGFDLLPLPLPKSVIFEGRRLGATYANFIFINGAVIVPTYGDKKSDEAVLNALAKRIKGRDIIGVDARVFIRQNGSLHCSSQNIYL